MRKLLIVGIILLVFGGLIALALLNLSRLVNRNKDLFLAQVQQVLGRQVTVGEIEITLWGGIGIRLSDLVLADDPAFSSEAFIRAADFQLNAEFLPLLWKELQITRVILHQPTITIIRNKQGQFNFASLGGAETPEPSTETGETIPSPAPSPFPLLVSLVNIVGGAVQYVDQQEKTDLRISQLDLTVEDLNFDQPLDLRLEAAVLAEEQNVSWRGQIGPVGPTLEPVLEVSTVPIEGTLEIDPLDTTALQQALPQIKQLLPPGLGLSGPLQATSTVSGTAGALTLSNLQLAASLFAAPEPNVKLTGRLGPLGKSAETLSFTSDIELGPVAFAQLTRFAPVAARLPPDLKADGPVSLKAHLEGTPDNLVLSGTLEATPSTIRVGDRFKKPQGTPLILSTEARLTPQTVALQRANIQLHTLKLTGNGKIGLGKTPTLDLTVETDPTDLTGWHNLLPLLPSSHLSGMFQGQARIQGQAGAQTLPTINGSLTLSRVQATVPQIPQPLTDLNATVTFTGQGATLNTASVSLGKTQLRLNAQVERFSPLTLSYQLSTPELWLADLQPENASGTDADVLKNLKNEGHLRMGTGTPSYQGNLTSGQGTFANLDYTDLQTDVFLADHAARIERVSLRTFGGSVQGKGRYEFGATPPRFTVTSQVRNLNLTELFRSKLTTTAQHIRGRANLDLNLTGSGQNWEAIKPTLQGQGQAEIVQGALLDVNIAEGALSGITGIPGLSLFVSPKVRQKYPEVFATQNTEFDELNSTFTVRDGKMNIDELRITAADYMTQGTGWINFDQRLNVHAQLLLSQKLSADIANDVKEAKYIANEQGRIEIPFALTGTLPDVTPKPDVAYVGRLLQRAVLRRGAEELEKRVLKKLFPPSQPAKKEKPSPAAPAQPSPPPAKSLEEELIRRGLDHLFGR